MSNTVEDALECMTVKENLHQEQLLELYWHITNELANSDVTLISLKRKYDVSMNLMRAIKNINKVYSSLEALKNGFKNSAFRKATVYIFALYKEDKQLKSNSTKLAGTQTLWKVFNTTRALNDIDYRIKLAEHLRAFIDKMSPITLDLEGLTYLKFHSCCGCDSHEIPPKGMFLFNYKGMSVPLCNNCWVEKRVDGNLVFELMLNYIKRIELTNNILSGSL